MFKPGYSSIFNQFNVMLHFPKLIPRDTLLKFYEVYNLPHFYYCSSVWDFCGARNTDKIEALNKRYLDLYFGITHPHTEVFLVKSTLLLYVIKEFRISLYYYVRACLSLIFLLI